MYYKLSNTAEREQIERDFEVTFKHPNLYRPEVVINGLTESNLPIITSKNPNLVCFSIWGLLPEKFSEDWEQFQNLTNTLNIDERNIDPDMWYHSAFEHRRCLIVVTGFFTSFLRNGITYPYYIGLKSGDPFYLAGIYNVLEDGFITCSLLVGKSNPFIQRFQSVVDSMPLIIPKDLSETWLHERMETAELKKFLKQPRKHDLHANPIAKELFHQNINYDSMLEPYTYEGLPESD